MTFEFTAFATRDPEAEGTLIALDAADIDFSQAYALEASESLTIRMVETATDSGYAWSDPVVEDTDCVVLMNSNLGDFNTLYKQFWFQARDSTDNCASTITVTRLADSVDETFSVSVRRGSCEVTACADGEIRNLDLDSCVCESLQTASGTVIDSIASPDTDMFRSDKGEIFTIREWATSLDTFEWSAPDATSLSCITEVADSAFVDQWNRYRQVAFETTTDDCRTSIILTNVDTTIADKNFNVVVWPIREPESQGTLQILDGYDLSVTINLEPEEFITFRIDERATDSDFYWFTPSMSMNFECVDLINNNFGDFTTGYSQWLF